MCDEKDIKNESEAVSETPSCRFPLRAGGTEAERFPSRSGGNLKEGGEADSDTDEDHPALRYAGMLSDLTSEQLQAFDEILKERLSFL
jgi:hypothetical protein